LAEGRIWFQPFPAALLEQLQKEAPLTASSTVGSGVTEAPGAVSGSDPWLLEISQQLALVRRLESEFPLIEEAGCKVGIGVATGADRIFVGPLEALDVEESRKLPLVTTKDVETGSYISDISKIKKELGFTPKVDFEEGILNTINYKQ